MQVVSGGTSQCRQTLPTARSLFSANHCRGFSVMEMAFWSISLGICWLLMVPPGGVAGARHGAPAAPPASGGRTRRGGARPPACRGELKEGSRGRGGQAGWRRGGGGARRRGEGRGGARQWRPAAGAGGGEGGGGGGQGPKGTSGTPGQGSWASQVGLCPFLRERERERE